jgi:mRNA interferase HigB
MPATCEALQPNSSARTYTSPSPRSIRVRNSAFSASVRSRYFGLGYFRASQSPRLLALRRTTKARYTCTGMHIISEKTLRDFWRRHPDAETPLRAWARHVRKARWRSFADVRKSFTHADVVGKCIVFNVGGNRYRLITVIHFEAQRQKIYVRHVLTHDEYDKDKWKEGCCA